MNNFRALTLPALPSYLPLTLNDVGRLVERCVCSPWSLLLCKLTIGIVSAYDIHQTVKYVEYLPQMELNPFGRWMMALDTGPTCKLQQTACFITAKFAGNFLCLALLEILASWKKHIATGVAIPVAAFQLGLLVFLICANGPGGD